MSELSTKFSKVAATNPYAQFPEVRSIDFPCAPSKANYPVAEPYLKWHVAQDVVNRVAAVIMSLEKADALGVEEKKRTYLHCGVEAFEGKRSYRQHLGRSSATKIALIRALEQAEFSEKRCIALRFVFLFLVCSNISIRVIRFRS